MVTPKGRVLRPVVKAGFSHRFQRVVREPKTWVCARGLGLIFPTCWSGERTLLHIGDRWSCPNCCSQASYKYDVPPWDRTKLANRRLKPGLYPRGQQIGSLHVVRDASTSTFCNLFLPDQPTRTLLSIEASDLTGNTIRLHTRRKGPNSGKIEIDAEVFERVRPFDDVEREKVLTHLKAQVLRFFAGQINPNDSEMLLYSWPVEGVQLS